jgi:hypothetical protein
MSLYTMLLLLQTRCAPSVNTTQIVSTFISQLLKPSLCLWSCKNYIRGRLLQWRASLEVQKKPCNNFPAKHRMNAGNIVTTTISMKQSPFVTLIIVQLGKKLYVVCVTRRFITVVTRAPPPLSTLSRSSINPTHIHPRTVSLARFPKICIFV